MKYVPTVTYPGNNRVSQEYFYDKGMTIIMGGSKEKRRRKEQKQQGAFDLRSPKELEQEKVARKRTRITVAVLVVVVVLGIFLTVLNSNFFYRNMTAFQVEEERFSIAEMNYYFNWVFHREAWSHGVDINTPLRSK